MCAESLHYLLRVSIGCAAAESDQMNRKHFAVGLSYNLFCHVMGTLHEVGYHNHVAYAFTIIFSDIACHKDIYLLSIGTPDVVGLHILYMHVFASFDVSGGTADRKTIFQHLFAFIDGSDGNFVSEVDVFKKREGTTFRQCHHLTCLEVTECHCHVVIRMQTNQLHYYL